MLLIIRCGEHVRDVNEPVVELEEEKVSIDDHNYFCNHDHF